MGGSDASGTPGGVKRRGPKRRRGEARLLQMGSVRTLRLPTCSRKVECPTQVARISSGDARGVANAASANGSTRPLPWRGITVLEAAPGSLEVTLEGPDDYYDLGSWTTGSFFSRQLNACCTATPHTWTVIGGAIIARDVGRAMQRRGVPVHYPLLAASGAYLVLRDARHARDAHVVEQRQDVAAALKALEGCQGEHLGAVDPHCQPGVEAHHEVLLDPRGTTARVLRRHLAAALDDQAAGAREHDVAHLPRRPGLDAPPPTRLKLRCTDDAHDIATGEPRPPTPATHDGAQDRRSECRPKDDGRDASDSIQQPLHTRAPSDSTK